MDIIKKYIGSDLTKIIEQYSYCPCGSKLEGILCNRNHYASGGYDKQLREKIRYKCAKEGYHDIYSYCTRCNGSFYTVLPGRRICKKCKIPQCSNWVPCSCRCYEFVWKMDKKYLCKKIICVECGYIHYKGYASCMNDNIRDDGFHNKCFLCHLWYKDYPSPTHGYYSGTLVCPICTNKLRKLLDIKLS